jgi:DNA-directed RNA polymerase specialized sigma24 family protein
MLNENQILRVIAQRLGIKINALPIYKKELIYLKNDGLSYKEIGEILNINNNIVGTWYYRNTKPNETIIEKLENLYLKRKNKIEIC